MQVRILRFRLLSDYRPTVTVAGDCLYVTKTRFLYNIYDFIAFVVFRERRVQLIENGQKFFVGGEFPEHVDHVATERQTQKAAQEDVDLYDRQQSPRKSANEWIWHPLCNPP